MNLPVERCPRCDKTPAVCFCAELKSHAPKRVQVLILQHPREPHEALSTARLAHLQLTGSILQIGLSWPNLAKASGLSQPDPKRWGVLYLGSGLKSLPPTAPALVAVNKGGASLGDSDQVLKSLQGIVLLDGTWSQAKTMWWRNAWLLKLRRLILLPAKPSKYGKARKEPRKECLSTIESISTTLDLLHESKDLTGALDASFDKLLDRATPVRSRR